MAIRYDDIWAYNYPNFPNAATRQQVNGVMTWPETVTQSFQPTKPAEMNINPNPYNPQGNIPVYGTQPYGTGKGFYTSNELDTVDKNHYEISQKIVETLLYRSLASTPRFEGRANRIFAPSVTNPQNTATFIGGKKGDVYGS